MTREPEEKLGYGMMDTAAPEGAFKMTNVHCKLLVLISKYGQMPVMSQRLGSASCCCWS